MPPGVQVIAGDFNMQASSSEYYAAVSGYVDAWSAAKSLGTAINYYGNVNGEDAPCQEARPVDRGHQRGVVCPAFPLPVGPAWCAVDEAQLARELEELNQQRQAVDRATLADARKKLEQTDLDARWGLVLAQEGWHPGVIGIVASRIVEETWRPVVMISLEGNEGKGSGRSIPAFDLHAGLSECRDLFVRFGGHRTAAGLTIDRSRLEEFEQRFDAADTAWTQADLENQLTYHRTGSEDEELSASRRTDLKNALRQLEKRQGSDAAAALPGCGGVSHQLQLEASRLSVSHCP